MAKDITSVQSGIVQEAGVNNPAVRTLKGKNQFPQSFQHPSTCMYGYVDPVAFAKCETGDVFPYKFVTDLNTFTMKTPFKSQVKMYSAAFKVPMESLFPRTYDILFAFAQKGDEVPQDRPTSTSAISASARGIFPLGLFLQEVESMFDSTGVFGASLFQDVIGSYIRLVFLLESIFSDGGIFAKANIHVNNLLFNIQSPSTDPVNSIRFDDFIDFHLYPAFVTLLESRFPFYLMHFDGDTTESGGYPIYVPTVNSSLWGKSADELGEFDGRSFYCSIDRMFELIRTGDWRFYVSTDLDETVYSIIRNALFFTISVDSDSISDRNVNLNIESILSYQIACIHFFNNPKIDYIYTVDLWRDNLQSIASAVLGRVLTFDYNGSDILYDVVSFAYMSRIIGNLNSEESLSLALDYFYHLFAYHRSLRYGDYFVGSRPEPIGVGDISLDEDEYGNISSLEVAQKLQLTRLLHKVAITGPERSQQIKYIFGGRVPEAPKDVPIRLSLEEFDVTGFEVNNTGSAQLSEDTPNITTTNLRLDDSRFMFEVEVNEPCWLVMVQYFEAHRIYANTIDRFAYHYDLYDDFVPDMQFVGDQDVKQSELLGLSGNQFVPFAYHLRNMEYKQRVSYASGGFLRHLPSWAFITDNTDGTPADSHITPEYIRSSPSEFDRFFKSLLGHSLGRRFHFITMNTNIMAPYRQMVYAPEILA